MRVPSSARQLECRKVEVDQVAVQVLAADVVVCRAATALELRDVASGQVRPSTAEDLLTEAVIDLVVAVHRLTDRLVGRRAVRPEF